MVFSNQDVDHYKRQVLDEVARRIGLDVELLQGEHAVRQAVQDQDPMALRVMEHFRDTYTRWYDKTKELAEKAARGEDVEQDRMELMGLMEERDITRDALIRYLDHHYPRSTSRLTA